MAIDSFSAELGYISELDDQPNDVSGLSAAELKALFDQAPLEIKEYINGTLIPQIYAEIAAAKLGVDADQKITSNKIATGAITTVLLDATSGQQAVNTSVIRDGAVTTAKLKDDAVTEDKLGPNSVYTAAIQALAVTESKIANGAVTNGKIYDSSVIESKLATGAVTNTKLGSAAVSTEKIADNAVTRAKISSDLTWAKYVTAQCTLSSGSTSWTVSVSGVTTDCQVIASPAPASFANWRNCGIRCTSQSTGYLGFTADSAPSSDVTANIIIFTLG